MRVNRRQFMEGAAAFGLAAGMGRVADGATPTAFSDWREGLLDIHHISTGRGESTFVICPDGTTMLIDAGDMSDGRPDETVLPRLPNASRTPGEWIATYVERFSRPLNHKAPRLDYVTLTHFHSDHIGCRQNEVREKNGYALSGITEVAEHVAIGTLVDRAYPDYAFPTREAVAASNPKFFKDYLAFVEHQRTKRGTVMEAFDVGSRKQFALKRAPDRFPSFAVRNIAANGKVGEKTVFTHEQRPDENMCCSVMTLSYGAFTYYTGGDCSGSPARRDVETPIGEAVGRVDAMSLNHHGCDDGTNAAILAALRPQIMVIPVWDMWHPQTNAFTRMTDKTIYPDDRMIFATGLHEKAKARLGEAAALIRPQGHVVIRVSEGGARFRVFVLDPGDFSVVDATDELHASKK